MGGVSLNGFTPSLSIENVPNNDNVGHGTHVAGIVGGLGVRSGGTYAGVAPGVKIVGSGGGAVIFVLSALARAIKEKIRPSDMACRYGGEELVVVLPEASLECAVERAEQMRLSIRATNLTHLGQTLPAPTASFGVAVYPTHGSESADLLKAADGALYAAKREGRDRISVAGPRATGQSSPN